MKGLILVFLALAMPLKAGEIWLGATTTLRDSGLLDAVLPEFEAQTGLEVVVLAQSTGQIFQTARDHNLDILITHDAHLEERFALEGLAHEQCPLMQSRYVLVGSRSDPAEIHDFDIDQAFQKLWEDKHNFVTRNDQSGTSERENAIWARNNMDSLDFRMDTGQGMGASLNIASALDAYIFSEYASFLAFENKGDLEILVHEGEGMENNYILTLLAPGVFAKRNLEGASLLAKFLFSQKGQKLIQEFMIEGKKPFRPLADTENGVVKNENGYVCH